jgi:hypothetical protein
MDQEQINKIERIIEKYLFETMNNTDYELRKMDVIIKYLIYQKLKDIDETLKSIDENLFISANSDIYEK